MIEPLLLWPNRTRDKRPSCEILDQIENHLDESFQSERIGTYDTRRIREICRNKTVCGGETGLQGPPPFGRFNDPVD